MAASQQTSINFGPIISIFVDIVVRPIWLASPVLTFPSVYLSVCLSACHALSRTTDVASLQTKKKEENENKATKTLKVVDDRNYRS